MVTKIRRLDMEVCTTLGMLTPEQAQDLRTAGLTAYNHNVDTSPEFYPKVTSTRKYEDRLETIGNVRDAGISVCAGGIIGLGEGAKGQGRAAVAARNATSAPGKRAYQPPGGGERHAVSSERGANRARPCAVHCDRAHRHAGDCRAALGGPARAFGCGSGAERSTHVHARLVLEHADALRRVTVRPSEAQECSCEQQL